MKHLFSASHSPSSYWGCVWKIPKWVPGRGDKILPANEELMGVIHAVCSVAVEPGWELLTCYWHCWMFCLWLRFPFVGTLGAAALGSAKPSCCFGGPSDMGSVCVCLYIWITLCSDIEYVGFSFSG